MPWLKAAAFVVYGPAAEMHFRDDPGSPCHSARLFRMRVRAFLVPIGRLSAASAVMPPPSCPAWHRMGACIYLFFCIYAEFFGYRRDHGGGERYRDNWMPWKAWKKRWYVRCLLDL